VLFLLSDQGLLRFEPVAERVTRMPLPADEPYPPLIPESVPYPRRDPRWVYFARLPAPDAGGQVFRVVIAENRIQPVGILNPALPAEYFEVHSRADVRREIDAALARENVPPLLEFVADARRLTSTNAGAAP
jgi:hypothetical protein